MEVVRRRLDRLFVVAITDRLASRV
eukprot:SAG31_NODE_19141_length_611_cov_0.740234_1_plen_24_part_10